MKRSAKSDCGALRTVGLHYRDGRLCWRQRYRVHAVAVAPGCDLRWNICSPYDTGRAQKPQYRADERWRAGLTEAITSGVLTAVNLAATHLDGMTQQSAALVEQAAAVAQSLKEQALTPLRTTAAFKTSEADMQRS